MPTLNFMPRFVEPIRSGTKHHTIRATRKRPIKPGDHLYLYCGARHPGAFRIIPEPMLCTRVEPISIYPSGQIAIAQTALPPEECERLAAADGFTNHATMLKFFTGRLPFHGNIIHWT